MLIDEMTMSKETIPAINHMKYRYGANLKNLDFTKTKTIKSLNAGVYQGRQSGNMAHWL